MNSAELDKLLKTASPPERPPEVWEQLPKGVTARLHWQSRRNSARPSAPRKPGLFAWVVGAAAACAILVFVFTVRQNHDVPGATAGQIAQAEKCYREIESLFPKQVQSVVFDETGSRIVLAEKADVPVSAPLYLKICGPNGCQQVVTFSGQQIRVNGDICDVLQDAAGHVLLVGKQIVWSSASLNPEAGRYHIEARSLEASS